MPRKSSLDKIEEARGDNTQKVWYVDENARQIMAVITSGAIPMRCDTNNELSAGNSESGALRAQEFISPFCLSAAKEIFSKGAVHVAGNTKALSDVAFPKR